jgi:hypothetical protein
VFEVQILKVETHNWPLNLAKVILMAQQFTVVALAVSSSIPGFTPILSLPTYLHNEHDQAKK